MLGAQIRVQDPPPVLSFFVVLSCLSLGLVVDLLFHEVSELKKYEKSCGSSARFTDRFRPPLALSLTALTMERFTNVFLLQTGTLSPFLPSICLRLVSFPFTPRSPPPQSLVSPNGLSGTLGPQWSLLGHQDKGWGVNLQQEYLGFITFRDWASLRISVFK